MPMLGSSQMDFGEANWWLDTVLRACQYDDERSIVVAARDAIDYGDVSARIALADHYVYMYRSFVRLNDTHLNGKQDGSYIRKARVYLACSLVLEALGTLDFEPGIPFDPCTVCGQEGVAYLATMQFTGRVDIHARCGIHPHIQDAYGQKPFLGIRCRSVSLADDIAKSYLEGEDPGRTFNPQEGPYSVPPHIDTPQERTRKVVGLLNRMGVPATQKSNPYTPLHDIWIGDHEAYTVNDPQSKLQKPRDIAARIFEFHVLKHSY